jgi:hypothetical protein
MRIYNLRRMTIPKVAVLATGLAAAVMVVTINPPPAQAYPTRTVACTQCHDAGGSVTATPSSATPAPGAPYTVALAFTGGAGGGVGYWISGEGGNFNGSSTAAPMTAPAAAGTYQYTVWMRDELTSSTTYSITVGVAPTTVPPTTVPPTTVPPTTIPPTTVPPTTVPPTTVPPTTIPPTTVPPTTVPPTTVPPTTVPPTTVPPTTVPPTTVPPTTIPPTTVPPTTIPPTSTPPPVPSGATITSLSPDHGVVGSKVRIKGSGFAPGTVKFGSVTAAVSSWSSTSIVIKVPSINSVTIRSSNRPFWYRAGQSVAVTVNPTNAEASEAVSYFVQSRHRHHDRDGNRHHDRDDD